jgi:CRP/FNR family transcriptional regulator
MAEIIHCLKSNPYFSGMSPAELDTIGKLAFGKRYDQEEIILHEGEDAEALYFVASGVVKIFKTSPDGKEQILDLAHSGESFNDVPMFDGGLNLASAQAMGPVLLCGITKNTLESVLAEYPQVALNIIKVMANRARQLVSLVEDLSFRHVIGRVARILLEHAEDEKNSEPRLTQRDIAAMAGTAREVVSRSIKVMEASGIIRIERHRIVIADKDALKKMIELSL